MEEKTLEGYVDLKDFDYFKNPDGNFDFTPVYLTRDFTTISKIYEHYCKKISFIKNLFLFIEQCDNLNSVKQWRNNASKLILGFMKRIVYGKSIGEMTGITVDKPGYDIFNLVLILRRTPLGLS